MKDVFSNIHRRNAWGGTESLSGPGSTLARAGSFSGPIMDLLQQLNVTTLLDAGCGDFNWMKELPLRLDAYFGIDLVPEIIAENRRLYQSPTRQFVELDITSDPLPTVDLILCRDCLVHFSFTDIAAALANFKCTGSTYLLTTSFIQHPINSDIQTGGWRQLNFQIPPFSFPDPLFLIDEQCHHSGGIYSDKRIALWKLSDIP